MSVHMTMTESETETCSLLNLKLLMLSTNFTYGTLDKKFRKKHELLHFEAYCYKLVLISEFVRQHKMSR